jgi:hypothetical protein
MWFGWLFCAVFGCSGKNVILQGENKMIKNGNSDINQRTNATERLVFS